MNEIPENRVTFTGSVNNMVDFLNKLKLEFLDVQFKGKYDSLIMAVVIYEGKNEENN